MKILTSILLSMIAMFLAVVFFPIGVVYSLIAMAVTGRSAEVWYNYFYRIAIGIDELGNTVCGHLFNDVLIVKTKGELFGMPGETISGVLGKNVRQGSLTIAGMVLYKILDKIQKNHCELSIDPNINNPDKA